MSREIWNEAQEILTHNSFNKIVKLIDQRNALASELEVWKANAERLRESMRLNPADTARDIQITREGAIAAHDSLIGALRNKDGE